MLDNMSDRATLILLGVLLCLIVVPIFLFFATPAIAAWAGAHLVVSIALGVVVVLSLAARPLWRAGTAVHKHKLHTSAQQALIGVAHETKEVLKTAREAGHGIELAFNDQMIPTSIKIMPMPIPVLPQIAAPKTVITEEEVKQIAAPLPGPCDFERILEDFRPTQQQIFLALGPGGRYETVPLKALCHVALVGATGNGKSVLMRLLLPQIVYVGAKVALADPHYCDVDPESGEDWRPLRHRLAYDPAVSYADIKQILTWLAKSEMPRRFALRARGEHPGPAFFLALDELPAIVAHVEETPDLLADLLREGRKVGIFLVTAAQDMLVKTMKFDGGAVRDCFRTAFYVGGDATSARVLLDVKGTVDDGTLGQGLVMLRSKATPQASLMRIPYVSNGALSDLLTVSAPISTTVSAQSPIVVDGDTPGDSAGRQPETGNAVQLSQAQKMKLLQVLEMDAKHASQNDIIRAVWSVEPKDRAGQTAADELRVIRAFIASEQRKRLGV